MEKMIYQKAFKLKSTKDICRMIEKTGFRTPNTTEGTGKSFIPQ